MITWAEFGQACAGLFGMYAFAYALSAIICYWPKEKIRRKRYQRKLKYQWIHDEQKCPDWADPALWHKSRREGL